MKYRKILLMGAFCFAVLLSVDGYRWVVRGKPPTVDGVIGSLLAVAVSVWCSTRPRDAWNIGFLTWVAAVVGLIAYIAMGRAIHLSPLEDAVATYATEFLPFVVVVGVVLVWERRAGRENE